MPLFGPPDVKKLKKKGRVKALIRALGYEKDTLVSDRAVAALAEIGAPAVEPLTGALNDRNERRRMAAVWSLGRIGDARAVEPLLVMLEQGELRSSVIEALGKIGDARAVESLLAVLEDDETYRVAIAALGRIGDPRALEPLVAALSDQNKYIREDAAQGLARLGWKPDRSTAGAWYWIAQAEDWPQRCQEIGAPAVGPLIACLQAGREHIHLGRQGSWTQKRLAADLTIRQKAAETLGQIGDARAVEPLADSLTVPGAWQRNGDAGVRVALGNARRAALQALAQIGDPRAVKPLAALLDDTHIGHDVAATLGEIGDPRAVPSLIAALDQAGSWIRKAAARSLGQIGDPDAVEALIAALDDGQSNVYCVAAEALGEIGDPRAIAPLVDRLDANENLRQAAADALLEIGDPVPERLIGQLQAQETELSWNQARALALLYREGRLSDRQKQLVLSRREAVERHHSSTEVVDQGKGCGHYDYEKHTDQHVDLESDVEL